MNQIVKIIISVTILSVMGFIWTILNLMAGLSGGNGMTVWELFRVPEVPGLFCVIIIYVGIFGLLVRWINKK